MRAATIVLALAAASPAAAATTAGATVADDVRCLLLSTGYARAAKDEAAQRGIALTGAFYLGRLSGHMSEPAVAAAVRAQGTGMRGDEAQPIMRACAARAGAAEQQMAAIARAAQGRAPAPLASPKR